MGTGSVLFSHFTWLLLWGAGVIGSCRQVHISRRRGHVCERFQGDLRAVIGGQVRLYTLWVDQSFSKYMFVGLVDITVVTSRALVNFVYQSVSTTTCRMSDFVLGNGRRMSRARNSSGSRAGNRCSCF